MEALKVTFTFAGPVVIDSEYPIHLDALLAWCVVDEAESVAMPNAWAAGDDLGHIVGRAEAPDEQWVWQASRLVFAQASERFMMNMVRKCEPLVYMDGYDRGLIDGRKRNTINSGSGQERAYQFLMPYQWFERAEAWCLGSREALEETLARLHAIGKLTRNGFGQIKGIQVEPDKQAADRWKWRTLPQGIEGAKDTVYAPTLQCIRAPYWKKTNRVPANEPLIL